jgi:hypothetical protein
MDSIDFFEGVENDLKKFVIPKMHLMQGISQAVAEGKAQQGDIVSSQGFKVLGTKAKPVEIIPVKALPDTSLIEKFENGKWVKDREEPFQERARDFTDHDGQKKKHYPCINFFVIVASEINDPDARPYLLSFRKTSYMAGKEFFSHFVLMKRARGMGDKSASPMALIFTLGAEMKKGAMGPYQVYMVNKLKPTTQEQRNYAVQWYLDLSSKDVVIDDSLTEETVTTEERF